MTISLCLCLTQCVERRQAIPWNTSLVVWASTQDQLGQKYLSVLQVDRDCLAPYCHRFLHTLGSWMLLSHKLNTCPSWPLSPMEPSLFRVGSRGQVKLFGSTSSSLVLWPNGHMSLSQHSYHPSWKKPRLCTMSNIAVSPSSWHQTLHFSYSALCP